jgi:Big-like domain-containing protein
MTTWRARSALFVPLCVAGWSCGGADLVLPEGGGSPSATRSTITADPVVIATGSGTSIITVTVLGDTGAPIPGASVVVQATGDGNTLTQPSGATGVDGIARATLQSTEPGEKVVSATVNASLELSRTASVTVAPATVSRMEPVAGDAQRAPVGTPVTVQPAVRVVDQDAEPVAGLRVTFAVTGGGGSIEGADQTTNQNGVARVGSWTLGPSPATNTLEARAAVEGSPVIFTAEGFSLVQQVDRLVFLVQPGDAKKKETISFRVALVDVNGDVVPLSEVFIYLDLFPEGSDVPNNPLLRGERFENTEAGVADFDVFIEKEGSYRLEARTDDLPELGPHGPEPYLFSQVFRVK